MCGTQDPVLENDDVDDSGRLFTLLLLLLVSALFPLSHPPKSSRSLSNSYGLLDAGGDMTRRGSENETRVLTTNKKKVDFPESTL